jgi:peptidoglycan/xylan/chitin deacetylase (PgdA/CDA1 family)
MLGWFSQRIFLGAAQRRLIGRGVPIFTYHKIADPTKGTRDPFLYVSPKRFDEQLAALKRLSFTSGSLDDFSAMTQAPGDHAVITFDDGFTSVLRNGLEILARHQFPAIEFLVAGSLGKQNHWDIAKADVPEQLMDEVQVREWLAAGHEIGSHSTTHRNLRHLSPTEAREEISGSKKSLEDRFGIEVRHFCYPYGSWNQAVRDLAIEAGYRTASTLVFGVNNATTPAHELRRIVPLSTAEMLRKIAHRLVRRVFRGSKVYPAPSTI